MKWDTPMGNTYKLTWRPWKVPVLTMSRGYWTESGKASGFLVRVNTWNGDSFFVKPESVLFTKQAIEERDTRISDRMKAHVEYVDCGCGCESKKPKDEWSTAWLRAASVVRCEPIP